MSSQEDYLDQLLRNIMNGGKKQPQPEADAEEMNIAGMVEGEPEMPENPVVEDLSGELDMSENSGMEDLSGELDMSENSGMEDLSGELDMSENSGMEDLSGELDMSENSGMEDLSGELDMSENSGMEDLSGELDMSENSGMEELSGELDMSGDPGMEDLSWVDEMLESPGEENLSGEPKMPEMSGNPGEGNLSGEPDMSGDPGMEDLSWVDEMLENPGEEDLSGEPKMPEMSGNPGEGNLSGEPDMSGDPGMEDLSWVDEMLESPGEENLSGEPEMSENPGMEDLSWVDEMLESPGEENLSGEPRMPEMSGNPGMEDLENDSNILGTPVEDTDIEALLKSFEDTDVESGEKSADSQNATDVSSMSEDEIEKLLAESRSMPEYNEGSPEDAFQGDVVDMLEGTEDSELQEIQNLLEKSDNNEAVGNEIEDLLRGAVQDSFRNSSEGVHAGSVMDDSTTADEQLYPRQRKAMEKKRIKEEKAAARKAEREARKAEKAARKAARKAGKGNGDAESESNVTPDGVTAETEATVDTAFLDSILSEAGKIDGAETLSSATGNYDAEVDNIIPDEEDDVSAAKNTGLLSSENDSLGIDMGNLFGGSAEAEGAMLAGGDSDLSDFVALDGSDVNGIIQLAGEDEEEEKPKKKGFFSRFLEFLTEEEEEEEENENIKLSEENQEIIEDLDKEKNKGDKKGKKGKKKVKKADASTEEGEEGGEGEEDKKGKKKKAKKPKKEKLPKEKEPVDPKNRLSLKKVLPIALICASLGIAIIIITYAFVDSSGKNVARNAYYNGDYQTCYQNLYGKDMNESEQIMYGKSQSILTIRMWIREYEMLAAEGAQLEALDSLIQSVNNYPTLYEYAGQWNAAGEVAQEYATILNLLYENYGLTEDQARTIAAEPDDIEYTRQVNIIVQGGAYGSWNEPEPVVDVPLQDELPEETELPEGNFIDTNTSVQ